MPPKRKQQPKKDTDQSAANADTQSAPSSPINIQPSPSKPTTRTQRGRQPPANMNTTDNFPPPSDTKPTTATKKRRLVGNGATTSAAALATAARDQEADGLAGLSPVKDGANTLHYDGSYDRSGRFSVSDSLMDAVVKVFAIHSEPNFSLPWQRRRQYASSGSGFVIPGRRILTNAHCIDYSTQVRVKRRGSDTKYLAQVLCIGAECDIAMLSVEDDAFWEGLDPVSFGELPRLQDQITVVGYPLGGDTMSVTSGVVSRIEVTSYVHGATELLGIQVDAAINSGNSGGPAFNDRGECIGIAFQSLKSEDIENISYVIPTPVIQHFITDYQTHGKYTGFPSIGVEWQKTESPTLRKALGLSTNERGVLVRRIEPTSPASTVLTKGDVILSFNGIEIGSDGTIPFRSGERIGFSYLVSQLMSGDTATLKILHEKQIKEVEIQLKPIKRLIPVHLNQQPPSYFILGGLVFTPASIPLLRSEYGKDFDFDSPIKLLDAMLHGMAQNEAQQVVILSQVLAHDINVGYEEIVNTKVLKVTAGGSSGNSGNSSKEESESLAVVETKINNLKDLVDAVEANQNAEFIRFDLEYNQVVILDAKEARKATAEILEQHCIAKDRSADLLLGDGNEEDNKKGNGGGRKGGSASTRRKK